MKTETIVKFLSIGILMGVLGIEIEAATLLRDPNVKDSKITVVLPKEVMPLPQGYISYEFSVTGIEVCDDQTRATS